ncbi:MAG TPA: hypothetical protein PLO14_15330 [Accumulibacter sp.]|uniref:hypothetical protein n=1 Tax=Accumulibacter sp. TaxID=2053492 RepID=UPI0025F6640B|nr:hypothetical protein [Accumulibacter sp.]MCM8599265.1 hypothetical protein [Accumulibacter sp.]MCM8663400.1 hypothetical protein [Accumulibacter sp.]HNC53578.1 hypothetical protein [Accumulibacter sp.]
MAGFENYTDDVRAIEREIERKGIVLGINWKDDVQVRALAREALDHSAADVRLAAANPSDHRLMAKVELFGLAALMLKTMEECAGIGIECHGGEAWKAFAKALWADLELRNAELDSGQQATSDGERA